MFLCELCGEDVVRGDDDAMGKDLNDAVGDVFRDHKAASAQHGVRSYG